MKVNFPNSYVKNICYRSRVLFTEPANCLSPEEKQYIDDFEENKVQDARFIGEGNTSRVFYSPQRNIVIKQNKQNQYIREKHFFENGSLAHESRILLAIGKDVKTTQRGIGYAETEKGGKFLVSELVSGKPADVNTNPYYPKHLDRLLRNLNRLDKSQIIHSDLCRPNLLLTDNFDVNIIDYQWAEQFNYDSTAFGLKNAFFPSFEAPNNALMFESASLSGYLRALPKDKITEFVRSYLLTKSKYTQKKIRHLQKLKDEQNYNIRQELIDFENAKYKAYSNPSDDVIRAEILKFNILNLNRRQYSCYDENKIDPRNILRAIPLSFEAKDCADELRYFKPEKDNENSEYFKFMNEYGKYWANKISKWYPDTLKWIYRLVSRRERDAYKRYFPEKFDDFRGLDIISTTNKISGIPALLKTILVFKNTIETKSAGSEMLLRTMFINAAKEGFVTDKYLNACSLIDNFFTTGG